MTDYSNLFERTTAKYPPTGPNDVVKALFFHLDQKLRGTARYYVTPKFLADLHAETLTVFTRDPEYHVVTNEVVPSNFLTRGVVLLPDDHPYGFEVMVCGDHFELNHDFFAPILAANGLDIYRSRNPLIEPMIAELNGYDSIYAEIKRRQDKEAAHFEEILKDPADRAASKAWDAAVKSYIPPYKQI